MVQLTNTATVSLANVGRKVCGSPGISRALQDGITILKVVSAANSQSPGIH